LSSSCSIMMRTLPLLVSAFGLCAAQVPMDSVGIPIGGYGGATSIEIVTPTTACMSSSSTPELPNAPAGQIEGWVAEFVDDEIWLCGGADLNFHSECFSLTIGSSSWKTEGSMNDERDYPASLVFNGEMVILGGYNNGGGWLSSVEKKDAGTTNWIEMDDWELPRGTFDLCGDQMDETHIIIVGGNTYGASANEYIDATEILDTTTGVWETMDPIPGGARASHGCLTTTLNGDTGLLVAGGCENKCQDHLDDAYFFSYSSKSWTTLANMNLPRMGFKMTHLDGKPAAIGGYNTDLLAECEMYSVDAWEEHPSGLVNDRWAYGMPRYVPADLIGC